jgi:hypothetical protein
VPADAEDDAVLAPLQRLGAGLEGGPCAALVADGTLHVLGLPGRWRLWALAVPGTLAAYGLQSLAEAASGGGVGLVVMVVGVLAAFYGGDRWSTRTTEAAVAELTPERVRKEAGERVPLADVLGVDRRDRTFGGPELAVETPQGVVRLAGDPELVARLEARLDALEEEDESW